MREVLFRGKNVETGEWIYGEMTGVDGAKPIIIRSAYMEDDCSLSFDYEHVKPATVSEFTGLRDKNGKRIFEGDIVQYPIEQGKHRDTNLHEVVFERRGGSAYFGIVMDANETWQFCLSVPSKLMEVVGNIYDNPELTGGKEP